MREFCRCQNMENRKRRNSETSKRPRVIEADWIWSADWIQPGLSVKEGTISGALGKPGGVRRARMPGEELRHICREPGGQHELDMQPQVHVSGEPYVHSFWKMGTSLFHKFLRNSGSYLTTRNSPTVQTQFWTESMACPFFIGDVVTSFMST